MKNKIFILFLLFILLAMAGCMKNDDQLQVRDETPALKSASLAGDYNMVPDEILVKFKKDVDVAKKAALLDKLGGKVKEKILTKMMEKFGDNEGISLITIQGNVADALEKAKGNPDIEYAEPNYIYTHFGKPTDPLLPNDPYYVNSSLWGMNGTYGIGANTAWGNNNIGSATVYVGVIDEGIQYDHADLSGQVWINQEDPADGVDNDGNGYIDDIHGWDFAKNDNTIYDGGTAGKIDAHGTHVAGTIGAIGNNNLGVVGVNWKITIISAKFLGKTGGTTANAILAVDYITQLKTVKGLNIVATNNSWGGGGFSQGLADAIGRANDQNILFVAAAGNAGSNNDAKPSYPSNYSNANVIAVAAITSTGTLASWSNYGSATVDLGAPGSGIWSTVPLNKYASYSGTSMATPHVTGGCALYAASHPAATAAQIKSAILSATIPTGSLSGKTVTGGRLNVSGF